LRLSLFKFSLFYSSRFRLTVRSRTGCRGSPFLISLDKQIPDPLCPGWGGHCLFFKSKHSCRSIRKLTAWDHLISFSCIFLSVNLTSLLLCSAQNFQDFRGHPNSPRVSMFELFFVRDPLCATFSIVFRFLSYPHVSPIRQVLSSIRRFKRTGISPIRMFAPFP